MSKMTGKIMNRMSSGEIGYLAGVFDGEGWIVTNKRTGVNLNISMTDYDVIEKLHQQTGIGTLNERVFKRKKSQLQWIVRGQEELTFLLNTILPFLCERRTVRVNEALAILEEQRIERERRLVEFVCGHLKSEENTYHFPETGPNKGKTSCRTCSKYCNRKKK